MHPQGLPLQSRVGRFAVVGLGGLVVQVLVLEALTRLTVLDYRAAAVLAVEAAVLHNFVWHERWTWKVPKGVGSCLRRAIRFHSTTALLSIPGNVLLMALFVEALGWPVLLANLTAVAVLGIANFRMADSWVFRDNTCELSGGRIPATKRRVATRRCGLTATAGVGLVLTSAGPVFAGPPAETAEAWDRYVALTERRINAQLADGRRFLTMDFESTRGAARRKLESGNLLIEQAGPEGTLAGSFEVPGGMIHHWRGYVFVAGGRLDTLMANVSDPTGPGSIQQADVLETRVLSRHADGLRLFLKLQRHSLVSVAYNTEHDVRYQRYSRTRASSRSRATRIAELDDVGLPSERERGRNEERGFLWRMNSYWRYEAVPAGVIVELESLTLSRGLPWGMRSAIRPLIERVARESIERTLVTIDQRARLATSRGERRSGERGLFVGNVGHLNPQVPRVCRI